MSLKKGKPSSAKTEVNLRGTTAIQKSSQFVLGLLITRSILVQKP